jgi:hypothetical protein
MESLEFGNEYAPIDVGIGGFMEGQTKRTIQTPSERFYTRLFEAFELLQSLDPSLVSREMKNKIEQFAPTMKNMIYKNATAFMLGCVCVKESKINKEKLNHISSTILSHFKNTENITTADVLRYARFAAENKF